MVLPTTYLSALLLLLIAFVCLGSWANLYKLAGPRWRFELFYFDFAIGAILVAVIAAFTFGTLGSDLAFSDRMLVAGRQAQAWVLGGGILFNLGNMLLVSAISLIGISTAFPMSIGTALIVAALFNFSASNVFWQIGGIILMIPAILFDGAACRFRDLPGTKPADHAQRSALRLKTRKTTKGIAVAFISGILLGLFYPITSKGLAGDLGLGSYAGMLLFCAGVLVSTLVFNFYFMNIAIEGGPLSFNAYFSGKPRQHFLGFGAGAICSLGLLTASLGNSSLVQTGVSPVVGFTLPLASVLLAVFWGFRTWREFSAAPKNAKLVIRLSPVFFACALVLFGCAISRLA